MRGSILAAGLLLSVVLAGCGTPAAVAERTEMAGEAVSQAQSAAGEAVSQAQSAAGEAVSQGASEAERISEEAGKDFRTLYEKAKEQIGEVRNEDGSLNMEALSSYGQGLYDKYVSGAGSDMSDLDALFQKADNVNAAMENYILERNAELLKPGEIRLLAGGNVQAEDFSDLKEFREIYCAIQYNYNKDRDGCLRYADGNKEVILFSLREEEDGSITIVDTRFAEEGEKEEASLKEMCEELNVSYDEAAEMLAFDRAYDVQTLMDYMKENPDVTGIEYEGAVRTYEEFEEIEDRRMKELFPEDFAEEPEGDKKS